MNKSILTRLLCGLLTVIMLVGSMSTAIFAAETDSTANEEMSEDAVEKDTTSLESIREILDTLAYNEYYAALEDTTKGTDKVVVNLAEAFVSSKGTKAGSQRKSSLCFSKFAHFVFSL